MGAHLATVLVPFAAAHCGERRCLIADIKFDGAVERRVVKSVSNLMMVMTANGEEGISFRHSAGNGEGSD